MSRWYCEYHHDFAQGNKYNPGMCDRCGAPLSKVYCYYFGKPVLDFDEYISVLRKTDNFFSFIPYEYKIQSYKP